MAKKKSFFGLDTCNHVHFGNIEEYFILWFEKKEDIYIYIILTILILIKMFYVATREDMKLLQMTRENLIILYV